MILSVGAELGWRFQGQEPTASADDLDLWASERARASGAGPNTIVIIGKSRAQLDLDGATIERRYPKATVVQLALNGRGAFAVFSDLAQDKAFNGRVLFSLTEPDLTLDDAQAQQPAVARFGKIGPDRRWNAALRAHLASRLALRSHLLLPERVFDHWSRSSWPTPNFIVTAADRFTHGDFERADLPFVKGDVVDRVRRITGRIGNAQTPTWPWTEHIQRIPPLLRLLRARGGDAIFLQLPVTEESAYFSDRVWPKRRFWDRFAGLVGGATVHWRDYGSLRGFSCPDTSHLDAQDAPRFTAALFKILERKGFINPGAGVW